MLDIYRCTVLFFASSEKSILLLSALGVDENAVSNGGLTVLMFTVYNNNDGKVNTLLQLNANTSNVVTSANPRVEIVRLLGEHRSRTV